MRKCVVCGREPAEGYASIWTAKDGQSWYCHGDDDDITCYQTGNLTVARTRVIDLTGGSSA